MGGVPNPVRAGELMYRKSIRSTICSGLISAIRRHTGFPARRAAMSHAALMTAPTAMCIGLVFRRVGRIGLHPREN